MEEFSKLAVTARACKTSTVLTCIALATVEENHMCKMSGTNCELRSLVFGKFCSQYGFKMYEYLQQQKTGKPLYCSFLFSRLPTFVGICGLQIINCVKRML